MNIPLSNFFNSSEIEREFYEFFGKDSEKAINNITTFIEVYQKGNCRKADCNGCRIYGIKGDPDEKTATVFVDIGLKEYLMVPCSTKELDKLAKNQYLTMDCKTEKQ